MIFKYLFGILMWIQTKKKGFNLVDILYFFEILSKLAAGLFEQYLIRNWIQWLRISTKVDFLVEIPLV